MNEDIIERDTQPVIIVTGASKGLGAAIATVAAQHGASVVLTARSQAELEFQAEKIRQSGGNVLSVVGDVSRYDDCRKTVAQTMQIFGRIDALINNAGTIEPLGSISEAPYNDWADHVAVNLLGMMMMCQIAIPHLRQTKGRVINITSHAAEISVHGASTGRLK